MQTSKRAMYQSRPSTSTSGEGFEKFTSSDFNSMQLRRKAKRGICHVVVFTFLFSLCSFLLLIWSAPIGLCDSKGKLYNLKALLFLVETCNEKAIAGHELAPLTGDLVQTDSVSRFDGATLPWSAVVPVPEEERQGSALAIFKSNKTFTLPSTSKHIFLEALRPSQGVSWYSGHVKITSSSTLFQGQAMGLASHYADMNATEEKPIIIVVEALYSDEELRDDVILMEWQDKNGSSGVKIKPLPWKTKDQYQSDETYLHFEITVFLPEVSTGQKEHGMGENNFRRVSTNLNNMDLTFANLSCRLISDDNIFFDQLDLGVHNGKVFVETNVVANEFIATSNNINSIVAKSIPSCEKPFLSAPKISLSSNNFVLPRLQAEKTIKIETALGRTVLGLVTSGGLVQIVADTASIDVTESITSPQILIESNVAPIKGAFTVEENLDIKSNTATIVADVSILHLQSPHDEKKCNVHIRNDIGSTQVSFTKVQQGLTLHSKISSSLGRVKVQHAPAFSSNWEAKCELGNIDVTKSNGTSQVTIDKVSNNAVGQHKKGRTWERNRGWDEKQDGKSLSYVETQTGGIILQF